MERADWNRNRYAVEEYIRRELARVKKVSDTEKRWAVDIPKMARDLGFKSTQTVRDHLSEILEKKINGVPVLTRVDGVEILIRDDPPVRSSQVTKELEQVHQGEKEGEKHYPSGGGLLIPAVVIGLLGLGLFAWWRIRRRLATRQDSFWTGAT